MLTPDTCVFPSGKYKGRAPRDVPTDYLQWVINAYQLQNDPNSNYLQTLSPCMYAVKESLIPAILQAIDEQNQQKKEEQKFCFSHKECVTASQSKIKFGKYKGTIGRNVPSWYLAWCCKELSAAPCRDYALKVLAIRAQKDPTDTVAVKATKNVTIWR